MTGWKRAILATVFFIIVLISGIFLFRNHILQWAFTKAQTRIHDSYKATLSASSVCFSGFNKVELKGLTLQPDGADTFLIVKEADANISLIDLLRAKLTFDQIKIADALLTIYNEDTRNNISFLRAVGRDKKRTAAASPSGFRDKAADWEAKLFRVLNTAFKATNIKIQYQDSAVRESVCIPSFVYDLHDLSGTIIDLQKPDTIILTGQVVKRREDYHFTIINSGGDTVFIPFLDIDHGFKCRFHSIAANIHFENSSNSCRVTTDAAMQDLHLNHWRLAKDDVILPQAKFKGQFTFTYDAVEMDSNSSITLGAATCHLFARYDLKPDTTFSLALHMPEIPADSFFQALPIGMFNTLKGISCTGTLAYDLRFAIHTNEPDSLLFYSSLKKNDLRIRHFGAEDYTRINGPFTYEAYEKDRLVRTINVSSANPYFTPLAQMPPFLPQSVLQAEDPSFMQHRGFLVDAFRESIAKNYKEKRFARGGSTISMQLVKNAFLNRDKTISRKAEEALIVFLIENLGLISKERMLEVYLNVIEWGPNVYGIGEAAHFYFNKRPSELTLQESLFLASIIPHPKSFQYEFDPSGQLRQSMGSYFKLLTTRMVWRGVLAPEDTVGLEPKVNLKGFALHSFTLRDTVPQENEGSDE